MLPGAQFYTSTVCQSLMNLALQLGMSSEPNLALDHSHNFSEYISLQPQSLVQHWWSHILLSKLFYTARQEYDHLELLRLKLLHNDHGNDWLLIFSSRRLGNLLSPTELRYLLRLHLGLPLTLYQPGVIAVDI